MEGTPAKAVIDVLGVVDNVEPWTTITKKDGTDTTKRPVVLRDQSGRSVELTLWGDYAMHPGEELEAVGGLTCVLCCGGRAVRGELVGFVRPDAALLEVVGTCWRVSVEGCRERETGCAGKWLSLAGSIEDMRGVLVPVEVLGWRR